MGALCSCNQRRHAPWYARYEQPGTREAYVESAAVTGQPLRDMEAYGSRLSSKDTARLVVQHDSSQRLMEVEDEEPSRPVGCCCMLLMFLVVAALVLVLAACFATLWQPASAPPASAAPPAGGARGAAAAAAGAGRAGRLPGEQATRLRVTNGCDGEALWLAHVGTSSLAWQNKKILPLESYDVEIPSGGLPTTRFWSKWRCLKDEEGNVCAVGDSGGSGQVCDSAAGCAPPVDTKFEATFGSAGMACNTSRRDFGGCDYVDVSVKDGFTVPFELEIKGDCRGSVARDTDRIHQVVECSELALSECPSSERLGADAVAMDLRAVNPSWGTVAACLSPCSRLTFTQWQDGGGARSSRYERLHSDTASAAYCCPTAEACNNQVLEQTAYVEAVHHMCPGVNSYAYDGGMAVGTCPAGTKYEMIFYCPAKAKDVLSETPGLALALAPGPAPRPAGGRVP